MAAGEGGVVIEASRRLARTLVFYVLGALLPPVASRGFAMELAVVLVKVANVGYWSRNASREGGGSLQLAVLDVHNAKTRACQPEIHRAQWRRQHQISTTTRPIDIRIGCEDKR